MNPQILIGALAILTFFKESISGAFKGENGKTLKIALVGIGAYFLYNRVKNSENKEELSNNIFNSVAGGLAQRLYNAFHPYFDVKIPFLGHLPDGTDETAVKEIAAEIARGNNYTEVSEAYYTLFSSNLKDDLNSEGVYKLFTDTYNQNRSSSIPQSPVITPKPVTQSSNSVPVSVSTIKKGSIVYTKSGWNLRSTDSPYNAIDSTVDGQDWIALNAPYTATIGGTKGQWIVIEQPKSRYVFYPSFFVVNVKALYTT